MTAAPGPLECIRMRMRPAALISIFLAISVPLFAADRRPDRVDRAPRARSTARHFILVPQHVLSAAEESDLAAAGCLVQRALPNGQYIVRVAAGSSVDENDLRVRRLVPLTVDQKVDTSAYRLAAEARPFARLKILFHDDVSMDQARNAIESAGGSTDLRFDFGPLHSLTARVPSSTLLDLAADDRVLRVYGLRTYRTTTWNATAAALSGVTPLYSAPYDLSGSGVVLSYFELGPADTTNPEFQGRLKVEFQCAASDTSCKDSDNENHATHVAGTMIAAGLNPAAKGMAPQATLHEYIANNDTWLNDKATTIKNIGAVADNNSWGYVLGWASDGSTGWTWEGADELIGGYDGTISAVLDHAALTNGVLMDHAAGNQGSGVTGPMVAPFAHNHVDQDDPNGAATSDVYCYSADGSGTDCPVPTCTTPGKVDKWGDAFCETPPKAPHPVHNPWGSIGWTASAKNVLAVGATDSLRNIASFSSRGPTKDGRVKPELTAKGQSLFSTAYVGQTWIRSHGCAAIVTSGYGCSAGTSMATPVVTGSMALLAEQWRRLNGGASPGPLVLKTLAIAGADDLGNPGPDFTYGFGFMNTKASADLIVADNGQGNRVRLGAANNGSRFDYPITLTQSQDLRVVLGWFDPEALPLNAQEVTLKVLINDLDLEVIDPDGNTVLPYVLDMNSPTSPATHGVNTVDNTEEVEIKGAAAGVYHAIVNGTTVTANPPQQFALIANANVGAAQPPCTDPTEPNSTAATAYGPLPINSPVQASICASNDLDFFRFATNMVGTSNVTVKATQTPLLVTLSSPSTTDVVVTVAAGTAQTLSASASAGTQFLVKVAPAGALGSSGAYTLTASYPFSTGRRGLVRR